MYSKINKNSKKYIFSVFFLHEPSVYVILYNFMFKIYNKYGFDTFDFEGYEVTIMKYSDVLCSVNDIELIRVNQQFMNLDENTQKFILYHELGHIYHGHNKQTYEVNTRNKRKRRKMVLL